MQDQEVERYREVFKVLDQLGWAGLKATFLEHCIEDQTLGFMETEEELKQLLKEIGIPLGKCIPIVKSWSRKNAKKHGPDLTKEVELSPLESGQRRVPVEHRAVQTVTVGRDASTQTDHVPEEDRVHVSSGYSAMMEELERVRQESQEVGMGGYDAGMPLNNLGYPGNMAGQPAHLNIPPPGHVFSAGQMHAFPAQVWPPRFLENAHAGFVHSHAIPASSAAVADVTVTSGGVTPQSYYQELGGDSMSDEPVTSSVVTPYYQDLGGDSVTDVPVTSGVTEFNGLGAIGDVVPPPAKSSPHKEIVDESDDLAIEQSLFKEMEKEQSQSYASALHTKSMAAEEKEEASNTKHSQPEEKAAVPPTVPAPTKTTSSKSRAPEKSSQFAKLDDIAVQSGTVKTKSTNFQNIGSATLQAYLDSLPESKEYRDAIARYGVKKGWKPIDGKHMYSGKKVQFKPIFCDKELRMRHGVPVRGADKSEECFRHKEGKAPAACTFAHSRLGDTLQFICVKCTCEKSRNDWCVDKGKHKQFIFNLGPYKNIDGETWKAVTT